MPYGYYKCDECGVESEKTEWWQGTGRYCINHAKCFCNNNKLLPFINLEEKPMKLEATSTFPKTMIDVLDGAPRDCEEFQKFYVEALSVCPTRQKVNSLFAEIDQKYSIGWLLYPENKPALDYALEKGWVRYKKEPRVIEVGRGAKVTMYWADGAAKITWKNEVTKIEIE